MKQRFINLVFWLPRWLTPTKLEVWAFLNDEVTS
jgi:hypothetical protein